jgi:hypothetical protein
VNAPERELLLAACGAHRLKPATGGQRVPPWDRLCADAAALGLTGQLFTWLQRAPMRVPVPESVVAQLRQQHFKAAARTEMLLAELEKLLVALGDAGVPVIVLKGAALAEPVYRNVALRPMRDLDLLVPSARIDVADRVLRALGYRADESYRPSAWYRDEMHHLAPYVSLASRAHVEIHHHVAPPWIGAGIAIAELWDRARPVPIGTAQARALGPEDSLLHTCVHLVGSDRCVGRLRDLCDLDEQVRHFGVSVQWTELGDRAVRYAVAEPVFIGLWLARVHMETDVPDSFMDRLRRPAGADSVRGLLVRTIARQAVFKTPSSGGVPAWIVGGLLGELMRPRGGLSAGARFLGTRSLAFLAHRLTRGRERPPAPPPSV